MAILLVHQETSPTIHLFLGEVDQCEAYKTNPWERYLLASAIKVGRVATVGRNHRLPPNQEVGHAPGIIHPAPFAIQL
jgi:hypothetical protein